MTLHVFDADPISIRVTVDLTAVGLAGSDIESAVFHAVAPDYAESTWTASLSTPTAHGIKVVRYLDGTELDLDGFWKAYVVLTYDGGSVRTDTVRFQVLERYG